MLPERDRLRLAKLLALSTSANDAEALSALRKAQALAAGCGLAFADLVVLTTSRRRETSNGKSKPDPRADMRTAADLLDLDSRTPFLSPFDFQYLTRLAAGRSPASERDRRVLDRIWSQYDERQ